MGRATNQRAKVWQSMLLLSTLLFAGSNHAIAKPTPIELAKEHMQRGYTALEQGKLGDACFEFKSATRVLPNWWVPHQEHLRCARLLGEDPTQLVAQATRILSIDEKRPSLHFIRGILLEDLERTTEALAAYERALELASWMTEVTLRKGRMLIAEGRWKAALDVCNRALTKRPNDILLLNQLTQIFEKTGEARRLIEVLEKLVSLSNVPTEPLARLVKAYGAIGDVEGRLRALKRLESQTTTRVR